ncbi:unnamed protein product [Larinioides sclopetarius]|uniref:Uncharacterized protein n=1 Tax=Larinioides sclopetarius TaxID=280406 RepID=A0AAV1ZY28_9ARAC
MFSLTWCFCHWSLEMAANKKRECEQNFCGRMC